MFFQGVAERVAPCANPGKLRQTLETVDARPEAVQFLERTGTRWRSVAEWRRPFAAIDHVVVTAARFQGNATRGRQAERICWRRERNKPLKGEAQGRHRRETEPEGLREERNAKRLRKPEGVAQSGEANPA
jgi:hypothetical protein